MDLPTAIINGKEVVIVEKQALQDVLWKIAADMRESKRKKISPLKEAMGIIGCGKTTFYKLLKDPKCLIRKSSVSGSYITESLEKEAKRLRELR